MDFIFNKKDIKHSKDDIDDLQQVAFRDIVNSWPDFKSLIFMQFFILNFLQLVVWFNYLQNFIRIVIIEINMFLSRY